ncbi:MAG TPA: VOC family protein [Actinomycetota bacterium]|jgi:predicted 3-demethylubiquinone-9 3-methyltransferase (glyoxalase superfamily)|nr:VOC family protein [Actinomycetota bacterium]
MPEIVPHLWFDTQAKEATKLYTSLFDDSRIDATQVLRDTPSGDCDVVYFTLAGQPFQAISAGPLFKFNPSVSFWVACASPHEVDKLWNELIKDGTALMPLDSYPFSEHYGWLQDRYGLSWQLGYVGDRPITQKITPMLLFVGDVCGKTEEAVKFYASTFKDTDIGEFSRYGPGREPEPEGNVQFVAFKVEGYDFAAMESANPAHNFSFNEAVSFIVLCDTQEQIDSYWERLSAVPEAEQCGWLKDRFGVSWQIVPKAMDKMLMDADQTALDRVTQAFLPMKKLDIAKLEEAYAGV